MYSYTLKPLMEYLNQIVISPFSGVEEPKVAFQTFFFKLPSRLFQCDSGIEFLCCKRFAKIFLRDYTY